jgi:CPA2 family monovalent cation:H+ antiporter-2
VALGAFIAGSLVGESGEEKAIERLILPVRDLFAAIFFVSVGMMLDPSVIVEHWPAVTVLTLVVIVGKFLGVSIGAFLAGNGTVTSVRAAMSLAQIGEFSFIIAGLGISLHATGEFLYPVAIAVSAITTLTTPWLIRAAKPVASFIDRKLPPSLQTFTALYGTWVEQLRERNQGKETSRMRRWIKLLAFDTAILVGLVIGAALFMTHFVDWVTAEIDVSLPVAFTLLALTVSVLALPFLIGIFRITRAIGAFVSRTVLPPVVPGKVDLAESPRRVLVVTMQLTMALVVGLPILALTQPFLPGWIAAMTLALLLVILGVFFWRSAANLQGHVKAGAEMIVEALVAQARKRAKTDQETLDQIKQLMPGIGEPIPLRLDESSAAVGKTLAQINLRGLTGASVLAILHGESGVTVPTASEVLRAGDVLALAGTRDSVAAAIEVLKDGGFVTESNGDSS